MAFRKSVFGSFHLVRAQSSPSEALTLLRRAFATGSPPSNEDDDNNDAKSDPSKDQQKKNKRSQAALELLQELLREPAPEPDNNTKARSAVNKHHHKKFPPPAKSTSNEKLDIVDGVTHAPLSVDEKSTWPWKDQLPTESDCKDVEMDEAGSSPMSSSFSSAFNARAGAAVPVYGDHADDHNDPFNKFQPGDFCPPEDLNWYNTENDEERKKTRYVVKPAKLFQRANQDPLELALNPDLLRHFLSPTGRIQPRRFTGLSAKEQRQMKRAVKVSRNLALLPFLSQYPRPSLEQRNELLGHRGSDDFQLYAQGLEISSEDRGGEKDQEKHRLKTTTKKSSSSFDARGYEMQQVEQSEEDIYKIDLDLEGLDDEFKKRR